MGNVPVNRTVSTSVEANFGDELARADRALRGVAPVLAHMLDTSGERLVTEAIIARIRGMLDNLAHRMLNAGHRAGHRNVVDETEVNDLSELLSGEQSLLRHLYTLAVEALLTEKLERSASLDPVLSPLLQELIASDQPATADLAMRALASQSRFMQLQTRMELPIEELPADVLAIVLERCADAGGNNSEAAGSAIKRLYDESSSRIGLLTALVAGMRKGAIAGLSIEHAGFALFASCLASLTDLRRDVAVLSCHEQPSVRLAVGLRAAGLEAADIETQLNILGNSSTNLRGIDALPPDRAKAIVARPEVTGTFTQVVV